MPFCYVAGPVMHTYFTGGRGGFDEVYLRCDFDDEESHWGHRQGGLTLRSRCSVSAFGFATR